MHSHYNKRLLLLLIATGIALILSLYWKTTYRMTRQNDTFLQTVNSTTVRAAVKHWTQLNISVEIFPDWTTTDPHDPVPIRRVYLYSATLALQQRPPTGSHIRITAFQEKRVPPLTCCLKRSGKDITTSPAPIVHSLDDPNNGDDKKVFAVVYQCHATLGERELTTLGERQLTSVHVTLAPVSTCPLEDEYYLPLHVPEVVSGGLAICGKVAYGSRLDPLKLVEWFEMQKLLGVDKIQILDLGNPPNLTRVFQYYQKTGLLSMFRYKLPGRQWGRGLSDETLVWDQLYQDETFPLLECRLRLAGYDYVMGIDMDEIILPKNTTLLKPFFQEVFGQGKKLSGVYFHVQFFIEEFGAEDKDAPLHVLRFLKSTPARWECYKYAYMPTRTDQTYIHNFNPYPGFSNMQINPEKAVIHHYRHCRSEWSDCHPPTIVDRTIVKFRDSLVPRVKDVLNAVGL